MALGLPKAGVDDGDDDPKELEPKVAPTLAGVLVALAVPDVAHGEDF